MRLGVNMVAYNFQKQFADAVESGKKKQTIRAPRKNGHAKVGDKLQLYTGMRRKGHCRKLRDAVCSGASSVKIEDHHLRIEIEQDHYCLLSYAEPDSQDDMERFAQADGFDSWEAMRDWFEQQHSLPFEGVLIMWD